MSVRSESTSWFDEIDLDPDASWLRMGTRQLGDRPWLVHDAHRADELALKHRLCAERHDEVFAAETATEAPSAEVLRLVTDALRADGIANGEGPADADAVGERVADELHPLDAAGRLAQEDFCLLRRDDAGWVLAAASLCFPSRWRLAEKMGRPLMDVHQPVDGYRSELSSRVDSLFDRLGDRIVWRRNWFVHPDDNLFQPDRPVDGDPIIPAERCASDLFVRSERQTLRTLAEPGWILFTIRIQQSGLGKFIEAPDRREDFGRFLIDAAPAHAAHRGMSAAQMVELRAAFGDG